MTEISKDSAGLTAFPEDIPEDCVKLELFANKIKKMPPSIGKLTQLKLLNVFNNLIGLSLPNEVGTLSNLEEFNAAANKLAMLKDVHFASWGNVTILSLNDNNLTMLGSLAPLVSLEELRLFANQLTSMPTLGASHPALKIYEIHKNNITDPSDDYFAATPALERLSVWKNQLTKLPSSLLKCSGLIGVQAQENPLESLPDGAWPANLETLFIQSTKISAVPDSLKALTKLKRVDVSNLGGLDDDLVKHFSNLVLKQEGGIFWDKKGTKHQA